MSYNASSIRVLNDSEILQFPWARLEHETEKHKKPKSWMKSGFEACYQLGLEPDYFIKRSW